MDSKRREYYDSLERKGDFNCHLNPIDWDEAKPVDVDFPYIPKGLLKIKYFFTNLFIVKPFTRFQAKCVYKLKVIGKENLKGIKGAILTCNHVAIFDCLVNAYALKNRKVKTVAAEFNNKKGTFGEYMRVGGMLPLSGKMSVMKKFNDALKHYLSKKNLILIYPEESMWHLYDKPRPYKNGAFFYAAKFSVPVVPMFITFRDSGKLNEDGTEHKYFTLNIAKPVYPDPVLSVKDNIEFLKDSAYKACVEIYEKSYNKKLTYEK